MKTWKKTKLSDFVALQRGHDLPSQHRNLGTVPIFGSSGLTGYHDRAIVKGPGVTIGRSGVGSMGVVSFCPVDYWPHNTVLYVTDFFGNDPRFVYYLLKTIDFRQFDSGSAQSSLNRNYIAGIEVAVPSLQEQRNISTFLGALDDKIALNKAMNSTLQELLAAVFKSWFVDFEPVASKAADEKLFLDEEVSELFPSEFEENEQGIIPKGWVCGSLGDIAENIRRGVSPISLAAETPYIGLEHMPRRSIALESWGSADSTVSGKFSFQKGEILFGKLRPYFHKVGVAQLDGVCSTDILVINAKDPSNFGVLLGCISSKEFIDFTDAGSGGTRMPRTNWETMARFPVILPPKNLSEKYSQMTTTWLSLIGNNIHESNALRNLRDALLPRLIAGEIALGQPESSIPLLV